jgi:hypothetical protein
VNGAQHQRCAGFQKRTRSYGSRRPIDRRYWQILLQKSFAFSMNSDSVALVRFATDRSMMDGSIMTKGSRRVILRKTGGQFS